MVGPNPDVEAPVPVPVPVPIPVSVPVPVPERVGPVPAGRETPPTLGPCGALRFGTSARPDFAELSLCTFISVVACVQSSRSNCHFFNGFEIPNIQGCFFVDVAGFGDERKSGQWHAEIRSSRSSGGFFGRKFVAFVEKLYKPRQTGTRDTSLSAPPRIARPQVWLRFSWMFLNDTVKELDELNHINE